MHAVCGGVYTQQVVHAFSYERRGFCKPSWLLRSSQCSSNSYQSTNAGRLYARRKPRGSTTQASLYAADVSSVNFNTHPFSSVAVPGTLLLPPLLFIAAVSLLMKGRSGCGDTPARDVPLSADVTADVTWGLDTMPIDTPATGDLIGTPAHIGNAQPLMQSACTTAAVVHAKLKDNMYPSIHGLQQISFVCYEVIPASISANVAPQVAAIELLPLLIVVSLWHQHDACTGQQKTQYQHH
eukprot:12992-Heterococcus_DN1.PRE.4